MAYTAIDDPSEFFQTALWTGTSDDSTKTVTNDGNSDLQPDWLWIKARSGTYGTRDHAMYDSTRGATKRLESSATDAEATDSNNTFNSDGFTLTSNYSINGPSTNHVGWQWKINGGTTATNNAGSNGATLGSVYQVNNTMGVSIGTYTGDGSDRDIYTGLSASGRHNEPDTVWVKNRDNQFYDKENIINWYETPDKDGVPPKDIYPPIIYQNIKEAIELTFVEYSDVKDPDKMKKIVSEYIESKKTSIIKELQ